MGDQQKVIYLFGPFRLDPRERQLICNGQVIRLQRKAFDVLLVLVRRSGQLVTKDELMREVWGGNVVEEANLTVHVSTLRKALNEQRADAKYIESVPKFGYRFVCEVRELSEIINGAMAETLALPPIGADIPRVSYNKRGIVRRAGSWLIPAAIVLTIIPILLLVKSVRPRTTRANMNKNMVALPTEARPVSTAISPDGRFVAYSINEGGHGSLWIRETGGGESRQLMSLEQTELWGIVFSPTENYLYYNQGAWDDAALYRLNISDGSRPEKLIEPVNSPIAVSPDGTQISYIQHGEGESLLSVANADGREPNRIASLKQPSYFQFLAGPAWSSDGKTLAVIVEDDSASLSSVVGYSVADGTQKVFSAPADWQVYRDLEWLPDGSGLVVSVCVNSATARAQLWELSYPSGRVRRITNDHNNYESISLAKSPHSFVDMVTQADSNIFVVPDVHNPTGLRQLTLKDR